MRRTGISRGSKPLQRKTPMSDGGAPLKRATPMKARRAESAPDTAPARPVKRAPARKARPRPTPRHTGPSADTKALVDARDGGRCVRCNAPANNRDHRRTRGSGGTNVEGINLPSNLLTLCGMGNTSGCHAWKDTHRADALRDGYALPLNGPQVDAQLVPVRTRRGWALFLNDGKRVPTAAPVDDDAREAWAA